MQKNQLDPSSDFDKLLLYDRHTQFMLYLWLESKIMKFLIVKTFNFYILC